MAFRWCHFTYRITTQHIAAETKWPPFCQQRFQINAFSWMQIILFSFNFHWSMFLWVRLPINQVQVMTRRRVGDRPLPQTMLTQFAVSLNMRHPASNNMTTSSNGDIFRVIGYLCGEFTGPGEFPTQRPVTRSFDVFFDLRLNKRLSKQSWGWWFETLSRSLWRHCNETNWWKCTTFKPLTLWGIHVLNQEMFTVCQFIIIGLDNGLSPAFLSILIYVIVIMSGKVRVSHV